MVDSKQPALTIPSTLLLHALTSHVPSDLNSNIATESAVDHPPAKEHC